MFCEKELFVPRESRLRLFLLEKSRDFQLEYLQQIQTLDLNPYFDINQQKKDSRIKFLWKSNEIKTRFLLYFQIDSKTSEYAPFIFESNENRQNLFSWKFILGIILACMIIFLLIIVIIYLLVRQRPRRDSQYIKDNDDQRQQLNQPYLTTASPALLLPGQQRPQSAYSTTSSIVMQQIHDDTSDRETLIRSNTEKPTAPSNDIDNFYEEIKEQQQQTALALRMNSNPNLYLEPNDFQDTKPFFQGQQQQQTAQPIRDHHEVFYYECEK